MASVKQLLIFVLLLCTLTFLLGFVVSRYLIDRTLYEVDMVLLRSAEQFQAEQSALMHRFEVEHQFLQEKLTDFITRRRPGKVGY